MMMPRVEHKTMNGIQVSKVPNLWLRILKVQVVHHQVKTDGNVEKVHQVIHDGRHHMIYGVSNILG
jgi:hypothetical protein